MKAETQTEQTYKKVKFAHELRISNYYIWFHEESESYHKVDIDFLNNQFEYEESDGDADQFCRGWWAAPVELTPEILQKAGFEVFDTVGGFLCWKKDSFKLLDRKLPGTNMPHVKNVHTLQNLYYLLTGTELTIEL